MAEKFYFVVNEAAAGGNVAKLWPKIDQRLNQLNVTHSDFKTNFKGDAVRIAKKILAADSSKESVIVAVGGDGTLHEILNGCKQYYASHPSEHQVPITFLPVGSGNDFARAMKISDNWSVALDQILRVSSPQSLVVGEYQENLRGTHGYFINNFGIGLDATIVHDANHSQVKHSKIFGKFSYILAALHVIRTFKPVPTTVITDFERHHFNNGFLITTTNIPYFGGGVNIVPTASAHANNLDLVLIEKPSWKQITSFICHLLVKKHLNLKFVNHFSQKHFTIVTREKRFSQIDGEETPRQEFDVSFSTSSYPFWIK
ncbi:hypothetical protein PL11_000635 [Lentilactobacillus curieae]|uniref:DAGKc domain-containing protein n=1 Tax=Lentilactobacillus curieae TaxID=1138822 RepID=A0A1S6QG08_9LACO|nr:YegS/Rv2252/BmrU family lipid kinase [Lentilactobacillus curieae]AQW20546.1 hypothetical protein PL11_000635 [Lentilactobacillus curieae]